MTRVVATQNVWYDGRTRQEGENFDCSDMEAKIMVATNKAMLVEEPVAIATKQAPAPKAAEPPQQESAPAQPMTTDTAGELTGKTRRKYQRRDMTAEDTD